MVDYTGPQISRPMLNLKYYFFGLCDWNCNKGQVEIAGYKCTIDYYPGMDRESGHGRKRRFINIIGGPMITRITRGTKLLLVSTTLSLAALPVLAKELVIDEKNYGKLDFQVKAMHILDAEDNGYDPNDGSAYLLTLKYLTPAYSGFSLAGGLYNAGDLFNQTDFNAERVARGMFVTNDGSSESNLGEIFLRYRHDVVALDLGRQRYATPLTTTLYSTMPNFYTAYSISTSAVSDLTLGLSQVTEMSFGARAMTDFALIGEGTGTAGAAIKSSVIDQAEFHDISIATLGAGAPSTNGMTVFNAGYKGIKGWELALWDYYVDDIANNIYLQADTAIKFDKMKLKLSGQYLNQSDIGASLGGNRDFGMFGLKATLASKGLAVFAAVNSSNGDTAMLNAWGGDPGYVSSIFSRNEYRENVDAYQIGLKYKVMKNLTFIAKHTNYGQSDTLAPAKVLKVAPTGMVSSQTDAYETDLILVYKPGKEWMIKLFHANRKSEYDGAGGKDLTQAHTRLIASWNY